MKILIIDDEIDILNLIRDLLFDSFDGAILAAGTNGSEGLLACIKTPFDLIVTDYKMPVMNGLDFVSILRRCDCPNQQTPVIYLSGYVPLIKDNANTFENVHFMEKPLHDKRFLTLVSMLTKRPLKKSA